MHSIHRWTFFVLCACIIASMFLRMPAMVFAQQSNETLPLRLITSPLPITLVSTPGSTVSAEMKLKNEGSQTEHLVVDVMKFSAYEEEGKPKLLEKTRADDYLSWVTFSPSTFDLAPNEWKTITATFHVPDTAAFGYYYAITFSRQTATPVVQKLHTSIVGATAVLALLEVKSPGAKKEAQVVEFLTDRRVYEFLPVTFRVKVRNAGNVHLAPHGNIFLDHGRAKDIALLEVNGDHGNILPQTNRTFTVSWEDGFPQYVPKVVNNAVYLDAKGRPQFTLKWDTTKMNRLRFGKYTAHLLLVYDDGQKDVPIEGKVSFWVIPWRLIAVAVSLVVFMTIGMFSTIRKTLKFMRTRLRR